MPTRDEIQAQMEALSKQLDDIDANDFECEVEKDGTRTRVRGSIAKSWLTKVGLIDAPADGDGDGGDGDGEDKQDPKPKKSGSGYFG